MSERPILATIDSAQTGPVSTVTVTLAYEDWTSTGTASAEGGDQLHLVAEAAANAVQDGIQGGWPLEIRSATVGSIGNEEVCLVQVADMEAGDVLFGVAGVRRDDVEKVMARAVLDATNRRLIRKLDAG